MLKSLEAQNIKNFSCELNEREAFKAIFDYSCGIHQLQDKDVGGLEKAKRNVSEFAAETLQMILESQTVKKVYA